MCLSLLSRCGAAAFRISLQSDPFVFVLSEDCVWPERMAMSCSESGLKQALCWAETRMP